MIICACKENTSPSKWNDQSVGWPCKHLTHLNRCHSLTVQPAIWQEPMGTHAVLLGFIIEHREPTLKKWTWKYELWLVLWRENVQWARSQAMLLVIRACLSHLYSLIILVNILHVILESYEHPVEIWFFLDGKTFKGTQGCWHTHCNIWKLK